MWAAYDDPLRCAIKGSTRTHPKVNCIASVECLDGLLNQRLVDGECTGDVDREVGHGCMHMVARSTWIYRNSLPYDILDRFGSEGIDGCVPHERKCVFDGNVFVLFVSSKVVLVLMFPPTRNAGTLAGRRNMRKGDEMQTATVYPYLQRKSERNRLAGNSHRLRRKEGCAPCWSRLRDLPNGGGTRLPR